MSERVQVAEDAMAGGVSSPDVPLQARFLERLSPRELALYEKAASLLAVGGGVRSLVLADLPLAGPGVYEALLARSWALRFADPERTIHYAEIAVDIALDFDPRRLGAQRVADLQARVHGEMANAYRAADHLRTAQKTIGQAYALFRQGTGDPYLKARLFDVDASLLGTLREFPLALRRLASLIRLYRDLGESHLAGRALITQALYFCYSGENEEAVRINEEGLAVIDSRRDPCLHMHAVHNHILFLVELGRYAQAKRVLFEARRGLIYRDRITALRFRGLEGRISYGLGELLSAEIAFREVKEDLGRAGMCFYGALVTLELSAVLLCQGRVEEAEREVSAAREIFLSLEIYRELLGSILYLEECFRRKEATPEVIELTVAFLRRKDLQIRPQRMMR